MAGSYGAHVPVEEPSTASGTNSCTATKSGSFNGADPAIALNRYAVERRGDEPLVSEPAVIDLLPSTVSTDGCKSGIQLGYKLRALTF